MRPDVARPAGDEDAHWSPPHRRQVDSTVTRSAPVRLATRQCCTVHGAHGDALIGHRRPGSCWLTKARRIWVRASVSTGSSGPEPALERLDAGHRRRRWRPVASGRLGGCWRQVDGGQLVEAHGVVGHDHRGRHRGQLLADLGHLGGHGLGLGLLLGVRLGVAGSEGRPRRRPPWDGPAACRRRAGAAVAPGARRRVSRGSSPNARLSVSGRHGWYPTRPTTARKAGLRPHPATSTVRQLDRHVRPGRCVASDLWLADVGFPASASSFSAAGRCPDHSTRRVREDQRIDEE